jgi:eukaryotic-like serine/threonine-protein kinase
VTTLTATGQIIAGRYELTRFIAGGAMGEVWEAHDDRMDRVVAVKILRPEYARDPAALERFRTEARAAAQLAHPGIAVVHDADDGSSPDQPPWMVQEFVPGRPLSNLLATSRGLDPFRVAGLIAQVAEAVHAAHLAGVVHRDLTPGNLLVCDGDIVKITDFGIARASTTASLTATGQVLGTAAYLSPEQVSGRPATPASDIYTLGVVLHECLTGVRPFSGANPVEVARAHVHQQPPGLPAAVPERLRAITADTMAKDPADRPASAAELAARLREVARARPASAQVHHLTWQRFTPGSAPAARDPAPETRVLPSIGPSSQPAAADAADPPRDLVPPPPADLVPTPPPDLVLKPATGAAAVRLAAKPSTRRSGTGSASARQRWSTSARGVRDTWQRHPISRIGLAGGMVILLVVLAVFWSG